MRFCVQEIQSIRLLANTKDTEIILPQVLHCLNQYLPNMLAELLSRDTCWGGSHLMLCPNPWSQRSARAMVPKCCKNDFSPTTHLLFQLNCWQIVSKAIHDLRLGSCVLALQVDRVDMCGAVLLKPSIPLVGNESLEALLPRHLLSGRGTTKSAPVVIKLNGANHCLLVNKAQLARSTPKVSFTSFSQEVARMLADFFRRSSCDIKSLKLPIPGKVTIREALGISSFNATSKP